MMLIAMLCSASCTKLGPATSPEPTPLSDPTGPAPDGMVLVRGGTYWIGSMVGDLDE